MSFFNIRDEILAVIKARPSKTIEVVELFNKLELADNPLDVVTELELMETSGQIERVGNTRIRLVKKFTDSELAHQAIEDSRLSQEVVLIPQQGPKVLSVDVRKVAKSIAKLEAWVNPKIAVDLRKAGQFLELLAEKLEG